MIPFELVYIATSCPNLYKKIRSIEIPCTGIPAFTISSYEMRYIPSVLNVSLKYCWAGSIHSLPYIDCPLNLI